MRKIAVPSDGGAGSEFPLTGPGVAAILSAMTYPTSTRRRASKQRRNRSIGRGLAAGCAVTLAGAAAIGQDGGGLFDLLESAQDALDTAIQEATDGEYGLGVRLADREQLESMLNGFHAALRGGDLDALAEWAPAGHAVLEAMEALPALEPYADWLRQRLDFADMAEETRPAVPAPSRTTPRPLPPPPPTRGRPPPTLGKPPPTLGKPPRTAGEPSPLESAAATAPAEAGGSVHRTDAWVRKLTGRPVPQQAERLAPQLKRIFEAEGIPPELVWMAEVESTFNPAARSPVGAVGLFQLMPATARQLGLSTEPDDQRLDPQRNARAAARYLDYLHGRFNDWPLAIAAYNGGEGRVSRLLKQRQASHFNGIAEQLPTETRMYVPKVLATIELREGQALR